MSMKKLYNEIKRQVNHEYHNWLATEDEHMAHDIWIRYKAKQDIAQQISDILMEEAEKEVKSSSIAGVDLTLEQMEAIVYDLCFEYKKAVDRYNFLAENLFDNNRIECVRGQRILLLVTLRNTLRKLDYHMIETLKKGGL